jgi:hypothetical protein
MTNAHDYLPIIFGQPIEDGLQFQTKSFASNIQPMQDYASALWNATTASKRRAIMDRGLFDPTRVREADINSPNPAAKIPIRPAAYGKPLAEAYFPIPYKDELSASFHQEAELVNKFADKINGQNPPQQGQFIKGNRTKHEYEDVQGHANSRNQTIALTEEYQVFVVVKEILKLNMLQYQSGCDLYHPQRKKTIKIDPLKLRQAVIEFHVSDGMTPTDKLMNVDMWQVAMQMIGTSPQLQQQYQLGDLFSYLMKLGGADITEFEIPEDLKIFQQQMQQWQAMASAYMQKGATFSTPMPQIPQSVLDSIKKKQDEQKAKAPDASLMEMLAAAGSASGTAPGSRPAKGNGGAAPTGVPDSGGSHELDMSAKS